MDLEEREQDTGGPPVLAGTLMFTDIEGSTVLAQQLGDDFPALVAAHHRLLRSVFARHGATELRTEGDAFFLLFESARAALDAAVEAQRALLTHQWPAGATVKVRMGLHTGMLVVVDEEYVGLDIHRAARIAGTGHGGQIVLSAQAMDALDVRNEDEDAAVQGHALTPLVADLGLHWLKDLDEPEHLYQALAPGLPRSFAPLRSLGTPTRLPVLGQELVGRRTETADVLALLRAPTASVVTLVGPGGVGKTRLALAVAQAATTTFAYGVFYVNLATVTDPAGIPSAVAAALDLDTPADEAAVVELARHVAGRRLLLVLDTFEHLLDGAPWVASLLGDAEGARVVVTSRAPLRLRDEIEFAVPPLGLPATGAADDLAASDAVVLFLDRARRVRRDLVVTEADLPVVAEICRRLDGLPLAIELAAARMKVLEPAALLRNLDRHLLRLGGAADGPSRQQTLHAAIDWSYGLLSPDEQRGLRWLAVFRGGATAEAAEAVLPDGPTDPDPLDTVTALADQSMLQVAHAAGDTRFTMLHTVNAYAATQLQADPDADLARTRHARYFRDLAESADLDGPEQEQWLPRLDGEVDNLRAALQYAGASTAPDAPDLALRLADRLGLYGYRRGAFRSTVSMLESLLAKDLKGSPQRRAWVHYRLGVLRSELGDDAGSRTALDDAAALAGADDSRLVAAIHNTLGVARLRAGDYAQARTLFERSRQLRSELHERAGLATVLSNLALVEFLEGDLEGAIAMFTECLALDRGLGNRWGEGVDLLNLAAVLLADDQVDRVDAVLYDAIRILGDLHDTDGVAGCLVELAQAAARGGALERAARLAGAATQLWSHEGSSLMAEDQARFDQLVTELRAQLGEQFTGLASQGAAMTTEQAVSYALSS